MSEQQAARKKVQAMGDDRLGDLFETAFQAAIDNRNNELAISEFSCEIRRNVADDRPYIDVRMFGMAGDTSMTDFCKTGKGGKVEKTAKGATPIVVGLDDGTKASFELDGCSILNVNDWMASYRLA